MVDISKISAGQTSVIPKAREDKPVEPKAPLSNLADNNNTPKTLVSRMIIDGQVVTSIHDEKTGVKLGQNPPFVTTQYTEMATEMTKDNNATTPKIHENF